MAAASASPFAAGTSRAGQGEIHLSLLPPDIPSFQTLNFTYPLKLVCSTPHKLASGESPGINGSRGAVIPRDPTPANVPLVFMLSYGGGLLPPDSISLLITLDRGTRLTLTTQGSTKIFPSVSASIPRATGSAAPPVARQSLTARIEEHAALLLAPDPVQPFAHSHYKQAQKFTLAPTASLCLLDWVIEGRRARGERWQAGSWRGCNEIWREFVSESDPSSTERVLMLRDAIIFDEGAQGPGQSSLKRENIGIFGTVVLAGPIFKQLGLLFLQEFTALPRIGGRRWGDEDDAQNVSEEEKKRNVWRVTRLALESAGNVLWTVADVRGSVVVKFTVADLESAKHWLASMWRWDGTIAKEFGDGGFMCLR